VSDRESAIGVKGGYLIGFIGSELLYGLQTAVQAKIISDIAGTSGIDTQAFATDIKTTMRKGITKFEANGFVPGFFAVAPADWETVELAFTNVSAAIDLNNIPFNAAAKRIYGVPVVSCPALTAGTGYLVAKGAVAVDTDSLGIQTKWSDTALNAGTPAHSDFEMNQVRARVEGRYATSVYQPLGVVSLDLSAA
jgi:hypothetical protein